MAHSTTNGLTQHAGGITTVDAHYLQPGFACVHVLERQGRAAIIDCGTRYSVPHVLSALAALGLEPEAVELVFVTHVHLDHAGGAGLLMQRLPNARALAHPRAASHLIDPTRLAKATAAVYGQAAFQQLYGELLPVPEARLSISTDGQALCLGGSTLEVLHTPGHALHHHALFDPDSKSVFTGDTFGLSYRATDTAAGAFIVPTTTPTQFDPVQLTESVRRLVALRPHAAYLTHFGQVTDVERLGDSLTYQIAEFVTIAERHRHSDDRQAKIVADMRLLWQRLLDQHGFCTSPEGVDQVLGCDLTLNAQGLVAWLERSERQAKG